MDSKYKIKPIHKIQTYSKIDNKVYLDSHRSQQEHLASTASKYDDDYSRGQEKVS